MNTKQLVRKSLLFGLGVYHISLEKLEQFVNEISAEGQLTPEEGKQLVGEVMDQLEAKRKEFSQRGTELIQRLINEVEERTEERKDEPKATPVE